MFAGVRRFITGLLPTTLAGKAAAVWALMLVVTTIVAVASSFGKDHAESGWTNLKIAVILATMLLSTIVLYYGVRYWNRIDDSLYPDIDEAWRAGLKALQNAGLTVDRAPLFLVLGGSSLEAAFSQAMHAAGIGFRVERAPAVAGVEPAMRWYVTDAAIYLFCTRVGELSRVTQHWRTTVSSPDITMPSRDPWAVSPSPAPSRTNSAPKAKMAYVGTISPIDLPAEPVAIEESPFQLPAQPVQERRMPAPDLSGGLESRRLRYLCWLVKRARRPRCGINGALTLLPFELSDADGRQLQAIIESIQCDSHTMRRTLALRFPLTGLVVGMERANGFNEFAKSLGKKEVERRLGAGFDVRRQATGERLQRLSDGICDSFEDFIYRLFGRQEALSQPHDNRKLYGLLCQVREHLKPKLTAVLGQAFAVRNGHESSTSPTGHGGNPPVFFSGCYLAATGDANEQQAFIKGVLHDKLVHEQSRVEWTNEALQSHGFFQAAVWFGWILVAALSGLLVMLLATGATRK